ncbi:PKD domain-containing protein [Pseudochryseolinea flava]|uniref:Glycoside hydrolase n=1 Tax=Pseudochryseolinea flava TaxID=2059302 RepID=A0A364Y3P8_9BACT|nr:discoidin domain-containing protein [Pseudochryseolinea flava]RAW00416.1 hypothetical protein DQQ10_15305 [Pseudochryseolinea flava]
MMLFYKLCRVAILLLLLTVAVTTNAQTLVWSDEFRTPKLDPEKWTTEVGGGGFGNGELQYYTSGESNVFVGSKSNPADTGYLVIEARRENYGAAPENKQFTSGRINTAGKFDFKYGTIVARMKLPDLQNGLWPAFWMLGANYPNVGWPSSGEIDILEAGFKDDWQNNVANKKASTTVHWFQDNFRDLDPNAPGNGWWGNASATGSTTIPGTFNDGFHLFKLTWTPTKIEGYVDGVRFYEFAIPANDANIKEFNSPFFVILNLAVGGQNFVQITDPNQITAPMPAQMLIDYVRVYENEDTETFQAVNNARETGTFGVFTETTPVTNSLGPMPIVDIWSNLTATASTAQEGEKVLSYTASPGNWFGMGIPVGINHVKNMQNFIDGQLHFHMKTTSTWPISIGFISKANGNAQGSTQSKPVKLDPAGNQYGLVRDGEWHEVVIPFTAFGNIEFRSINNMFYLVGDSPSAPVSFAIDNIYWSDGTKITPENGDYVIYSDTHVGVDKFDLGTEGDFFVWETTLNPQVTTPAEGTEVLSFTHNNKGWFGAAFTASAMHNLTAFKNENAKLVFSLKTSDAATPFFIGMKSGTRDGEGQKWIAFEPGKTPYGFQRNGTWQTVEIPLSDFYDAVNFMEVTQLFQLLGTGNIANIAIDNIYFKGGLAADPDLGPNKAPLVNAGENKVLRSGTSVSLTGTAEDTDGTVEAFAWTKVSGPNTPTLSGSTTLTLSASNLIEGTYVFRLTATDDGGVDGFDEVSVFVGANLLPQANAGEDVSISLPTNYVGLEGSGADADGTIVSYEWSVVSGPGSSTIDQTWKARVSVNNLAEGVHEFKLTVGDNEGATAFDIVKVTVMPNEAPTANAGNDQTITLPTSSALLKGIGEDTGTIESYEWTLVSGPNEPTFSTQGSAEVTVTNLVAGTYVFKFSVHDLGGLTATDEMTVVVVPAAVNLALLKTVTVSSIENGTTPGSAAVDGNVNTRWSSLFADPQWIQIDLGDQYVVNRVKITWEPAYAKDYKIEFSEDANVWVVAKTVTGNSTLVNDHTGLSGEGRYVRIYGTTRATPYGYSIFELEVYGHKAGSAPVVNAGDNVSLALPTTEVTLESDVTSVEEISVYAWSVVSGPNTPVLSGVNTPTLHAAGLVEGTYVFKLTVIDEKGTSASDEVTVVVETVTDVEGDLAKAIKLYPNPASSFLYIEGVNDGTVVQITSTMGSPVGEKVVIKSMINIEGLPAALYILNVNSKSTYRKKFIKR